MDRCDPNQIIQKCHGRMPYGGKIHIEVDIRDSEQSICITDNGVGMSEVVLNTIGQPFNTTKKGGNRLGIMATKNY